MPSNGQRPEYQRLIQRLNEDKKQALEVAHELFNTDLRDSLSELSLADNHPADIGTEVYERARDVARHDALISRSSAIDAALTRWDEGKYGICEHCGGEIPLARLEVIPHTTVCTVCSKLEEQEEQHSFYRQPVENELLNSSFTHVLKDTSGTAAFDREDAFQAVARFGTSDSPQDVGTNRNIEDYESLYEDGDEALGAVEQVETLETERAQGGPNTIHYSKKHERRL